MPELGDFSSIGTKSAVESPSAERPAANPAQICDVLSNFGTADSWLTRFLSENFPELTAASRAVSVPPGRQPARQNTPVPSPEGLRN